MRKISWTLLGAVIILASAVLQAQAPINHQGEQQDRRVSLDVVVSGKDGVPGEGLAPQDFSLRDNKAELPISEVQVVPAGEPAAEVILVIDAVNLSFIRLAEERSRIGRFLQSNETLPAPTALAFFTDDGMHLQDGLSTNGAQLRDTLDHYVTGLRTTRRGTQYQAQDRFTLSIKGLTELVARESSRPGRKLIMWISPGWPLLSGPEINLTGGQQDGVFRNIVALTTEMLKARVTLYSLNPLGVEEDVSRAFYYQEFLKGVTKPSQAELGNLSLQVLATQSGGRVLNSSNDLENELKSCFADTKGVYTLTFARARAESANEYHHLEVTVTRPGFIARTKSGYYAQP